MYRMAIPGSSLSADIRLKLNSGTIASYIIYGVYNKVNKVGESVNVDLITLPLFRGNKSSMGLVMSEKAEVTIEYESPNDKYLFEYPEFLGRDVQSQYIHLQFVDETDARTDEELHTYFRENLLRAMVEKMQEKAVEKLEEKEESDAGLLEAASGSA